MTGETMTQPLVTVVVRTCNHEQFVEAALESVYKQDHEALELVIIDDRSTDRTVDLVQRYARQERVRPRFRRVAVIEQEKSLGAPAAFNRGIHDAQGSYVNVLPGNERFAPARVSTLLRACTERGAELAFARVEPSADGSPPSAATLQHVYGIQDSISFFPTIGYALLSDPCVLSAGNLLFTRRVFDRIGGFADLQYCYDWDFALRSVLVTEPAFVAHALYYCRLQDDTAYDERTSALEDETARVIKNYLFLCRTRPVENAVAPSPAWGPFFDGFVRGSRYAQHLAKP